LIYKSNLTAPDLAPFFKHLQSRPMPHSYGHDVPSDWADKADDDPVYGLYKRCGFWTHDEAAILFSIVTERPGEWLDIGAHTGWTGAHIIAGGANVVFIDPMLRVQGFQERLEDNLRERWDAVVFTSYLTSSEYFKLDNDRYSSGVVIDGDHEPGEPLKDARNAAERSDLMLFHDFVGRPVREAVEFLMGAGFNCRVYNTPHIVACCWRGKFTPPDHVPDPKIPRRELRCPEFDFGLTI
jgi:hypothetical protein